MTPGVFSTLRQRVTLLLISVLVPAAVLLVMNALSTRNRDRTEVEQEATRLAALAGATPAHLAETTQQLFAALSQVPAVRTADPGGCRFALAPVLASATPFQNIGLLSADGTVLCSAAHVAGAQAEAQPWLREALAHDRLVAGAYEVSALSARPTVILARRAPSDTGDRVLFAALNLPWLTEVAADVPLPPGSSVTIADDGGTVLARHPADGTDDVERLYGSHRITMPGGTAFTISVGIPLDVAYGPANARLRANLAVLAVIAVLTLLVARQASDRLFTRKIDALLRAARRLSAGDLSARTEQPWSDDEFGELARTFDSMAWVVGQRTEDLRQMMESLRALAARLESVREEERTSISREIHDELGQTLTGIRIDLDRLEERIEALDNLTDGERAPVQAKIAAVRRLTDAGLDTARRISRQLRPSVLDVLGLHAGIEWQLEEFHARTRIATESLAPDDLGDIGEAISIALFRILQESLTNVMRHAAATSVTVRIDREADAIVMEVSDNGRGFEQPDRPYPISLGLLGMRERAASLGGLTTVASQPGRGTTVHVRLPLPGPERAAAAAP